jgi:hypothetical protein
VTATSPIFTPQLVVWRGATIQSLSVVATGVSEPAKTTTRATFAAASGVSYPISVDSPSTTAGAIALNAAMAAPDILSMGFSPGGAFSFSLAAPADSAYRIESSDDLLHWATVAAGVVPASGMISFTDPSPANGSLRFYRVVLEP